MCKISEFLNKYNTVIFDMDGVITFERQYWNAAAMTVWEYFHSEKYFGKEKMNSKQMMSDFEKIRNCVFSGDNLIMLLKSKGVNSNWDLAYVTFMLAVLCDGDFAAVMSKAETLSDNILDEYTRLANTVSEKTGINCERNGTLWLDMQSCFQEWFLGDEIFERVYNKKPNLLGKKGFCYSETPLIDGEKLKKIFSELYLRGVKIGIATGRPESEMRTPLETFGIMKYIDKNSMISYDYVVEAESKLHQNVTKPHPYMFLKAMLGNDYPNEKIISNDYPKADLKNTLAVGDAAADLFASHAAGMDFCAVLTGVAGKSAKAFFEKEGAEYIFDSLENFLTV